jgi:hypothetical protein
MTIPMVLSSWLSWKCRPASTERSHWASRERQGHFRGARIRFARRREGMDGTPGRLRPLKVLARPLRFGVGSKPAVLHPGPQVTNGTGRSTRTRSWSPMTCGSARTTGRPADPPVGRPRQGLPRRRAGRAYTALPLFPGCRREHHGIVLVLARKRPVSRDGQRQDTQSYLDT